MATFGYTSIGASGFNAGDGTLFVNKETVSEDGTVTSISTYTENQGSINNYVAMGIYEMVTYGLLGESTPEDLATTQGPEWLTHNVSASISNGSSYDIGMAIEEGNSHDQLIKYDSGTTDDQMFQGIGYNPSTSGLPATFNSDSTGNDAAPVFNRAYSIYATYTAGGGGSSSVSPSVSPSASVSPSSSESPSVSPSASVSPSSSESPSVSPSASVSPSSSESPSISPSASISPSSSESPSVSPSASISPSSSESPSVSPSASVSPSSSESPSVSPSASISPSSSESPSVSPSASVSPSPSEGYENYTRGDEASLPTTNANLETNYSAQDYTDVNTSNDTRVAQTGTGQYMIHQFKDFVGSASSCNLNWEGQTTKAPSSATVTLQIYNHDTDTWDNVDTDSTTAVNTDFVLEGNIADLTNYKDTSNVITCRVYQQA